MSSTDVNTGRDLGNEALRRAEQRSVDDADPAKIERNIDETRADVRATLSALEQRLSVDRLIELTVGRIRDRGGEFASNLGDAAARNPVPLLLTAVGIGWLMLTSARNGNSGSYIPPSESLRNRASGMKSKVMDAGDSVSGSVRERLHGAAESSRHTFDEAAESIRGTAESLRGTATRAAEITRSRVESAREGAAQAQERMRRMLDEQPLMLGALGLAAGALIGALLPSTEAENRLVGEVRDKAVRRVAETGRAKIEAARESAQTSSAPDAEGDDRPSRTH
jgi:Protein of unknown function (DUF3618)